MLVARAPQLLRRNFDRVHARYITLRPVSMLHRPRRFATDGFQVISASEGVEEERLPMYEEHKYYPVRIGDVMMNRYQVVAKLGFGTTSTVWLSRDLSKEDAAYWALKVHVHTYSGSHELAVYRQLEQADKRHPGWKRIRACEDDFTLEGPDGKHDVFVMSPLGLSLQRFQNLQPTGVFEPIFVSQAVEQALLGLDVLHDADIIHSDLHSDNVMIGMANQSVLAKIEEQELKEPSPRKIVGDRIIYLSRNVLRGAGPLTISDLGQARIGSVQRGVAMPVQYRAPEIILNMEWGKSIDIWSVGLMAWDLLEKQSLFRVYDRDSQEKNDAHHLAAMTALLGPPPPEFLERSEETKKYWAEDGQWRGPVDRPSETDFESLITTLDGEEKKKFAHFMACCVAWDTGDRLTAFEAFFSSLVEGGRFTLYSLGRPRDLRVGIGRAICTQPLGSLSPFHLMHGCHEAAPREASLFINAHVRDIEV